MYFASDNSGPVPQQILDALAEANASFVHSYGDDALTAAVAVQLRALFEAPEAAVFLVSTGTAANVLALSSITTPWQTIFCTDKAHIQCDEGNAPEFFTGGAKLSLVPGGDRMTPDALRSRMSIEGNRGIQSATHGPVSISQVTEGGQVYGLDEIAAIARVARDHGVPLHMDGARFANALVALGCTPAEMTWKAGVDVLSFGATKNGCLACEAVIFFDPGQVGGFERLRKRGAHLVSKHRYLAAQMQGYLQDDLWLDLARRANARCRQVTDALRAAGAEIVGDPRANTVFARLPARVHQALFDAGVEYYLWGDELDGADPEAMLLARFVCDWSLPEAEIARFAAHLDAAAA